jgi:hypothetical protein
MESVLKVQSLSPAMLVLGVVFVLALLANWFALGSEVDLSPLPQPVAELPAPQSAGEAQAETDGAAPSLGQEMVARPLFHAGRRPIAPKDATAQIASDQDGPASAPGLPDEIYLAGIVRQPGRQDRALIRFGETTKGVWMEAGQHLRGWRISEIAPNAIVLEGGGERRTVLLFRGRMR